LSADSHRLDCETRVSTLCANPFFVLEVAPDAGRAEVERAGARILGLLAAGLAGADQYRSPLGTRARDAEMVRTALAELRDPARRLAHEWWARGLLG
jgi:hypothetical protein